MFTCLLHTLSYKRRMVNLSMSYWMFVLILSMKHTFTCLRTRSLQDGMSAKIDKVISALGYLQPNLESQAVEIQ